MRRKYVHFLSLIEPCRIFQNQADKVMSSDIRFFVNRLIMNNMNISITINDLERQLKKRISDKSISGFKKAYGKLTHEFYFGE